MTLDAIDRAVNAGARLESACEELGLSARTIQRWRAQEGGADLRVGGVSPANKLSDEERALVLATANSAEFRDVGPKQIVPVLADRAEYVASESTFYRILKGAGQMTHREPSKPAAVRPRELTATGPCQVWSWDITYLRSPLLGQFFYLYLIVDVFSRKVVAARVHADEDMELSAALMADACQRERIEARQLSLHSDNGSPMKGATMLATLQKLGVAASFSRPGVSDDNAYSEALFRTLKYRPGYPKRPFRSLHDARAWVDAFVTWYNEHHLHSAIGFVTPADRHAGRDIDLLRARRKVYAAARARNPQRWTGPIRNWDRVEQVHLNSAA